MESGAGRKSLTNDDNQIGSKGGGGGRNDRWCKNPQKSPEMNNVASGSSRGFSREMYSALINRRVGKLDLSGMSEFKQGVIRRTLSRYRSVLKNEDIFIEDPSREYSLEYNATNDQLCVKNVQVQILEQSPGPGLQCSQCSFISEEMPPKKASYMETKIFYHILNKHLHVFRCPFCGKEKQNFKTYKAHITTFHNSSSNQQDNHGETVESTNKVVRWLSKQVSDKPFQSKACGMRHSQSGSLKMHEKKVHHQQQQNAKNSRFLEEGHKVFCGGCEKQIPQRNFKYCHRKLYKRLKRTNQGHRQ